MKTIFSTELNSINGGNFATSALIILLGIIIPSPLGESTRNDHERRDDRDTDRDARHHFKF
ncbi:MAG: hypothetical protein FJ161_04520 [Gammaproteobacteria bacterium]|nr:hypothetical protein [Gammaproteobacteria bacterium]